MSQSEETNDALPGIEPLLTVGDLARILKCSERVIRYWRSKRLLPEPDVVLERMVRWRPQTVVDWIARGARRGL